LVNIDKARVASYDINGMHFEILVDPDLALEIKQGKKDLQNNLSKLLATEEIYKKAKSGDRASEVHIKEAFGTEDLETIVETIIQKGHLDLTTEQKRRIAEQKRKEIIDYIVRNSYNPVTNSPHTYQRVETAIEKAKIQIDSLSPVEQQVDKIVSKMTEILPISFKKYKFKVSVPIEFGGKINSVINKYEILDRKWTTTFNFIALVPAGEKDSFMNTISGLTKGQATFDIE